MPIYEYHCPACQKNFDLIRPMSQASEKGACPKCGQPSERAISRVVCLSKDGSGYTEHLGGGSCKTCTSSSCASCQG